MFLGWTVGNDKVRPEEMFVDYYFQHCCDMGARVGQDLRFLMRILETTVKDTALKTKDTSGYSNVDDLGYKMATGILSKGDFAYNPARVNIGSLGRNEFDFDGCVSPVYVVFSVLDGYENYFDLFRKTDFFKDSVASLAIGGVRQSLSYDDLSLIETIIPSENIVEEFNNLYNEMKKTIKTNKLENSRLSLSETPFSLA